MTVISPLVKQISSDPSTIGTDRISLESLESLEYTEYIEQLITEDDTPVDNIYSEKHQRLMAETLYSSKDELLFKWPFMVAANVGIFEPNEPNIVPDVFISLGVQVTPEWQNKKNRSYLISEFGKAPEIAVEIISNKKGNENSNKMARYARMGVLYYVMFDPLYQLSDEILRMYQLDPRSGMYQALNRAWFPKLGLGLTLWEGEFEGTYAMWLRWCDRQGELIPTGAERAEQEQRDKEIAQRQAEQERQASNERILTVARNLLASMDDEAISQVTGLEVMTIQQLRIAN